MGDPNNDSIVIKATYGQVSFLLTGDAEDKAESALLASGRGLKAQILKLGHHGSRTSTGQSFLDAVQPDVAIYSAGKGNSYGHPHGEVVDRVQAAGIDLYGTDVHGTITVTTDGQSYEVSTAKSGDVRAPPSGDNSESIPVVPVPVPVPAPSPSDSMEKTEGASEQTTAALEILSVTSPVAAGSTASLTAKTSPGVSCSITVRYKSGPSKAKGLENKTAGSDGEVSWSWGVGSRTSSGTWPITVKCGDQTLNIEFVVR